MTTIIFCLILIYCLIMIIRLSHRVAELDDQFIDLGEILYDACKKWNDFLNEMVKENDR